ncbi:flagellar export protein FliJ [Candidatus Sumerlaeota bacterium]|nr:flagellar export protein FliJ [Candidatus Sumerlaeota bacterium]
MARFRFSLEDVLDYRRRIEEYRQREMNEVQRNIDYVEDLMAQARDQRDRCRRDLNAVAAGGGSFARQELYLNYLRGVDALIRRSEEHLDQLRIELERRRERLAQASRARRVLDELRRDELRSYLTAERRAEDKEYGEIAIRNFLAARREENA